MWSSGALSSALSSLMANQLALSVASNNIANAGDPDYPRRRLLTAPAGSDGGSLGIGRGVDVVGVEAIRNDLVETRLRQETAAKSGAETLAEGLKNIENVFNDANGSGLLDSLTNFFNSFQPLSQDPSSLNFREQLKLNANALVNAFHTRSSDLTQIKSSADKAISADLDQINSLAKQIPDLTMEIKSEDITHPVPDLRDRRAALVKQLSTYVDINEVESGTDYQITTKNNRLLVFNNTASSITAADVDSSIGKGSLRSALDIRDTYVPKYLGALDQLAYEITQRVNAIHSAGYDLNGNTNINFFAPLALATDAARLITLDPAVAADTREIAASTYGSGTENGVALQLGNLLHDPVFSRGSVTDQYGNLIYAIGTDSSSAQSSATEHDGLLTQLQNRRQSFSGVSIDEESMQILQFQRAYEASARVIQVVDELLKTTLNIGAA